MIDSKKLLSKLKKKNDFAVVSTFDKFDESDSNVEWIKSDFYDLNRSLSGNLFRFMPANKALCLFGPEQTGKSLILYNIIKNVQKQGYTPIIFDTENAFTKEIFDLHGIDKTNGIVIKVFTIENLTLKYHKMIDFIREEDPDGKYAFFLDSLGNVFSDKFIKDIGKGELKLDQGLMAKAIKAFMKMVMAYTTMYNYPFVFTNHLVGNPNKENKYVKDKPFGGYSVRYLCHQMVSLSISQDKDSSKTVKGMEIKAVTTKNRVVPPFQISHIKLSFEKGLECPYYGLLDIMEAAGIAEKNGKKWEFKHIPDKKYFTKEVYGKKQKEIFTPEILEEINEFLSTKGYSKIDLEVKKEIEELDEKETNISLEED